ncbi:hypothetical protein [Undibacterium parvum]|uniref:Uncharacterized protein n=1 Tax=Undibacterium parvum TaxID=401471 RepID=A0A3Q9BRB0_9BURK|nr:hypothetical protein [Undibacterium parvum]AZP12605.1 hypothetical protein EJN92_11685 [Undibacterium parvum]
MMVLVWAYLAYFILSSRGDWRPLDRSSRRRQLHPYEGRLFIAEQAQSKTKTPLCQRAYPMRLSGHAGCQGAWTMRERVASKIILSN